MALECREKKNKPLKNPLKELVVVHTDKDFLADIEGKLYPPTQCILYSSFWLL
jgi:isoleucyl-tRNA synthetase